MRIDFSMLDGKIKNQFGSFETCRSRWLPTLLLDFRPALTLSLVRVLRTAVRKKVENIIPVAHSGFIYGLREGMKTFILFYHEQFD